MLQKGSCEVLTIMKGTLPLGHASAAAWVVPESWGCVASISSGAVCHLHSCPRHGSKKIIGAQSRRADKPTSRCKCVQRQGVQKQLSANVGNSAAQLLQPSLVGKVHINRGFAVPSSAFHSQAVLDSGSDDDNKPLQHHNIGSGSASSHTHAGLKHNQHQQQNLTQHQSHHHQHQVNQHKHNQQPHQPHRHALATGQLHVAHGRRHVTSISNPPDPLSQQLLGSSGLGVLRRIMLKYKANMGPEQVANTLLALQHQVLQARQQRGGQRPTMPHPAEEDYQHEQLLRSYGARSQPRVRVAQNLGPATKRAAERDGPLEQLTSQVLGELGNMIWHFLGDMSGPELAKLLYSWARLEWHPESQLLADVTTSFYAAARAGTQGQEQQQCSEGAPLPPVNLGPREPWVAAGLWGLSKIEQPLTVPSVQLLVQEWPQLLHLWSPQQLVDIAWALTATADEQAIAEVQDPDAAAQETVTLPQLQPVVLGLAEQLVKSVQQAPHSYSALSSGTVWPEVLLYVASGATAPGRSQQQQQLNTGPRTGTPQLAWRMLQAVAGMGIDVSVVGPGRVGELVDALSRAMQPQGMVW